MKFLPCAAALALRAEANHTEATALRAEAAQLAEERKAVEGEAAAGQN